MSKNIPAIDIATPQGFEKFVEIATAIYVAGDTGTIGLGESYTGSAHYRASQAMVRAFALVQAANEYVFEHVGE